jgi:hypothetical protein
MIPEAIEAGERALKLTKENHSYYKDQLKKFKQPAASQ